MKGIINIYSLFILLVVAGMATANAAVTVYTDRTGWESAVSSLSGGHTHLNSFESIQTGALSSGQNWLGDNTYAVILDGDPGFNMIDDASTEDPFFNTLSPDGSTYYLGEVGVPTLSATLRLFDLDRSVQAFAADWVVIGDLFMQFSTDIISFANYLPSGEGFLGVISDQPNRLGMDQEVKLSGSAFFGMDNALVGASLVPLPASLWLMVSGMLGLLGVKTCYRSHG